MACRGVVLLAGHLILGCGSAICVAAQDARPARPFSTSELPPPGRQAVRLNVSFYQGYGTDPARADRTPLFSTRPSSLYSGVDAALSHHRSGRTLSLGWTAGAHARRDFSGSTPVLASYSAGGFASANVGGRTSIGFAGGAGYSPYFVLAIVPPLVPDVMPGGSVDPDFASTWQAVHTYHASATLTRGFGRRSSLVFDAGWQRTRFTSGDRPDWEARRVGGRFLHPLSRYAALRLGYMHHAYADQPTALSPQVHDLDVGIDYNRPLSVSRRTTIAVGFGSAAVRRSEGLEFRVTGSAALNHEIGRTWRARVSYGRSVQVVEGLPEPAFVDTAQAALGGNLSRRAGLRVSAAYSTGRLAIRTAEHASYTASAQVSYAVTRRLALYARYSFYDLRADAGAAAGLAVPAVRRHSAQAGVSLRFPLLS